MRYVELAFPLIVAVSTEAYTDRDFDEMVAAFERYFLRGERYALVSYAAPGVGLPGARDRRRIAAWANEPRVRGFSERLCVGSTVVVQGALTRGMMTALLWFWKPASPLTLTATPGEAVDWCLDRLTEAGIPLPKPRALVHELLRREVFTSGVW